MTLETIYYITQIIAVGAILASLVAIYIQQRKDHEFAMAESQREVLQQVSQWLDDIMAHPTGLESMQRCLQSFHGASARQQAEFCQYMVKAVTLAEQAVYMHKTNLIVNSSYEKIILLAAMHVSTPGGREYWADIKVAFGPDVVAAIDRVLEMQQATPETLFQVFPYYRPDGHIAASDQ